MDSEHEVEAVDDAENINFLTSKTDQMIRKAHDFIASEEMLEFSETDNNIQDKLRGALNSELNNNLMTIVTPTLNTKDLLTHLMDVENNMLANYRDKTRLLQNGKNQLLRLQNIVTQTKYVTQTETFPVNKMMCEDMLQQVEEKVEKKLDEYNKELYYIVDTLHPDYKEEIFSLLEKLSDKYMQEGEYKYIDLDEHAPTNVVQFLMDCFLVEEHHSDKNKFMFAL